MKEMMSKLNNEEGSAIVIVLILLVALTMIGIVSTDNTVVELQIVRNDAIYRQNFYKAEAAVVEAAEILEDMVNTAQLLPTTTTLNWLKSNASNPPGNVNADMTDITNWKDNADPPNWPFNNTASSNNMDNVADPRNNTRYAAIANGVIGGLGMTGGTSLYSYSIYGLFDSTSGQGRSLILMGYNKKF